MDQNDLYFEGPTAEAHEAELSDLDVFLGGLPEETIPTTYIRIQHSAVGVRDIPVDETHTVNGLPGYVLSEVLEMGHLTYTNQTQFWAGETQVDPSFVAPINSVITAVGVLKGG